MNVKFVRLAALVAPLTFWAAGCNKPGSPGAVPADRTPAEQTEPARQPAATSDSTPPEADRDSVNVDVNPGQGVNVDVEGEPIRDRIRERRIEREAEAEAAADVETRRPSTP